MTSTAAILLPAILLASPAAPGLTPGTERERQSYALGADLGQKLRAMALDVDPALVAQGVGDALAGRAALLGPDERAAALDALQTQAKTRQAAALAARTGKAFLAANRQREGVVTLASGVQYRVVKPGSGHPSRAADAVECHYRGTLLDGTEFDSSYRHGHPATLRLGGDVVPGLAEALKLMDEGARWQIVVPPELAFGEHGSATVGPNATLLYEVELLAVR